MLDKILHREDPEIVAEREAQEAAFKAYFVDQYKTVVALFKARGMDITDLATGPQEAGKYKVKAVEGGLHATRITDLGNTEEIELTPYGKGEDAYSRAILKNGNTILDPGITYEHTGKFHIDSGTIKPVKDVKTLSTGKINVSDFKSGSEGKALDIFVATVRALPAISKGK